METEYTERDSLISQQDARIKELEGMVALQADALKEIVGAGLNTNLRAIAANAISAQQAAHDAEISKFKEEVAHYKKQGADRLIGLCKCGTERDEVKQQLSIANERIEYLEGMVALQANALEVAKIVLLSDNTQCPHEDDFFHYECPVCSACSDVDDAISATAETVQAARDKLTVCQCHPASCRDEMLWRKTLSEKTEPLRREVAMLHELLCVMRAWSYTAGDIEDEYRFHALYPTKYRPVSQKPLWAAIINAINNTQATAQAYEQEVEARGEIKAMEELAQLREREMVLVKGLNALNYTASENSPNACIVRELLRMTPSQTADQVLRWHVEWMRTLPVAQYIYIYAHPMHEGQTFGSNEIRFGENILDTKVLVAVPPLPKESKESPETDLDEAQRRC